MLEVPIGFRETNYFLNFAKFGSGIINKPNNNK